MILMKIQTIDTFVQSIRHVAAMLNYGELHIFEAFKNTLPSYLCWVLFPIKNLRQRVDTVKRILPKEKLDMQLGRQNREATPFLTMKEEKEQRNKMVVFDKSNVM